MLGRAGERPGRGRGGVGGEQKEGERVKERVKMKQSFKRNVGGSGNGRDVEKKK